MHITQAGIFRSLSISLVDYEAGQVDVVRSFLKRGAETIVRTGKEDENIKYPLDSTDPIAEVAPTREMLVIEGYDDRFARKLWKGCTRSIQKHA